MDFSLTQSSPSGYKIHGVNHIIDLKSAIVGKDIICTDSLGSDILKDFFNHQVTLEIMENANEKLYKWLTFLSNPTGKETEEFMKTDGEIKEAMDVLYKISGDKEAVMLAEMREKAMMDE